jgi:hypothetical protein
MKFHKTWEKNMLRAHVQEQGKPREKSWARSSSLLNTNRSEKWEGERRAQIFLPPREQWKQETRRRKEFSWKWKGERGPELVQ